LHLLFCFYKKIITVIVIPIIIIIIIRFVQCHKVITSEALELGSVLVSRGRRETLGKEECL